MKYRGSIGERLSYVIYRCFGNVQFSDWRARRRLRLTMLKRSPVATSRFYVATEDILRSLLRLSTALTLAAIGMYGIGLHHLADGREAPEFTKIYTYIADIGASTAIITGIATLLTWLARFLLKHCWINNQEPHAAVLIAIILLPSFALSFIFASTDRPIALNSNISDVDLYLRCNTHERLARKSDKNYVIPQECTEWLAKNGTKRVNNTAKNKDP